jgi:hypothetical protein
MPLEQDRYRQKQPALPRVRSPIQFEILDVLSFGLYVAIFMLGAEHLAANNREPDGSGILMSEVSDAQM